jgi:hypothetical protein
MREFITQDGNRIHLPDTKQRNEDYHCACHERMGNDFYFLPMNCCLEPLHVCTNPRGQSLCP